MKKNISKLMITAAMAVAGSSTGMAQTNLGAECGCPTIAARAANTVNISTVTDASGNFPANFVMTCDKKWVLDEKAYVLAGRSLTIMPGTAIFANTAAANAATSLVVSRGGKIIAAGTESCPIVFTATGDNMDGSFATPQQLWGGVVLLGKATNNLTTGCGSLVIAPGVGKIEGIASGDYRSYYGADLNNVVGAPFNTSGAAETFDDDDNSGILRYVSIRHGGATIATNNELNGLTLGSIGRGTVLEFIEVVANSDDGIEFFGGVPNVKYAAVYYSDDDNFDWDHGFNGKGQFWYTLMGPGRGDHGMEIDSDDNNCGSLPISNPQVFNYTCIGRNNSGDMAIEAKEGTGGRIKNSVFANFVNGPRMATTGNASYTAYGNWTAASPTLVFENNTFVNMTGTKFIVAGQAATVADSTRMFSAGNNFVASVAGFDYTHGYDYTLNSATAAVTDQVDPIPNPALGTVSTYPVDGFFTPVTYRGAFASSGLNWLKNWSFVAFIDQFNGLVPCQNDVNNDGVVNVQDFNSVLGAFGTSCD
jgi:hypothetical protein